MPEGDSLLKADGRPAVSVVIPTYNRASLLAACLETLSEQTLAPQDFEVLVVDDGSTDETTTLLQQRSESSPLRLGWWQQDHAGPAAARNFGVAKAHSDVVAFTDDDCLPDHKWLEGLLGEMPRDTACAGVGGPIRRVRDTVIGRYIDNSQLMSHWQTNGSAEFLITANAMFRTALVREVGGFNPEFSLAGGEDADLSIRLRRAGYYLIVVDDKGFVRHRHHDSLNGFYRMCWRHGYGAGQLAQLGLIEHRGCALPGILRQTARNLLLAPAVSSSTVFEAVAWRVLTAVKDLAKCAGTRAWERHTAGETPVTISESSS